MSGDYEDEEQTALQRQIDEEQRAWEKSQRLERIATAVLAGMHGDSDNLASTCERDAEYAVKIARALIHELDKEGA